MNLDTIISVVNGRWPGRLETWITKLVLDSASQRSVSPDRTWLKYDIQNIMLTNTISYKLSSQPKRRGPMSNLKPVKDSEHMISYKLSSHPKALQPILREI